MSLTLNMIGGGGGGLSADDALLRVQAPAGSTVTITKGSTTKTDQGHENAGDPSFYDYYFIIHQSQFDSTTPWTVTATFGSQSAVGTIVIDSANEYDMELSYNWVFVENGVVQHDPITAVGMKPNSSSSATAQAPDITTGDAYTGIGFSRTYSSARSGVGYFPEGIDVTNFSTLRVVGSARNNTGAVTNGRIVGWTSVGEYLDTNKVFEQQTNTSSSSSYVSINFSIDVSSYSGQMYFGVYAAANNNGYVDVRIENMWLE